MHFNSSYRSLKQYFFLSQSSFLTHFLDLSQTELKKPAKGASLSKLQSLLDISLTEVGFGFREDVKVVLASTNLYDWLFKVLSVSGTLPGPEETEGGAWPAVGFEEVERKTKSVDKEKEKAKEKEKDRLAGSFLLSCALLSVFILF
jgi:gamma-tubulin complex component 2